MNNNILPPMENDKPSTGFIPHCRYCNAVVDDELKADPFFMGVYRCKDCRTGKKPVQQRTRSLPSLREWTGGNIPSSHKPMHKPAIKVDRKCNKCEATKTCKWYTDRLKAGHICKSCYTKRRQSPKFDGIETRACTRCEGTESATWYQDPHSNGYICVSCNAARKAIV